MGLNTIMKRASVPILFIWLGLPLAGNCGLSSLRVLSIYSGLSCFLRVFDRITILKLYHVISWPACLFVSNNGTFFSPKLSVGFHFRDWYNFMNRLIM